MADAVNLLFDPAIPRPLQTAKARQLRGWRNLGIALSAIGLTATLFAHRYPHLYKQLRINYSGPALAVAGLPLILRNAYWLNDSLRLRHSAALFNELCENQGLTSDQIVERVDADWGLLANEDFQKLLEAARPGSMEEDEADLIVAAAMMEDGYATGVVREGANDALTALFHISRRSPEHYTIPDPFVWHQLCACADKRDTLQWETALNVATADLKHRFFTFDGLFHPLKEYWERHGTDNLAFVDAAKAMRQLEENVARLDQLVGFDETESLSKLVSTPPNATVRRTAPNRLPQAIKRMSWEQQSRFFTAEAACRPSDEFAKRNHLEGDLTYLKDLIDLDQARQGIQMIFALNYSDRSFDQLNEEDCKTLSIADKAAWQKLLDNLPSPEAER